jgi:hypothetical protein
MYNIYLNLFIVSVDMHTEKKYILSSSADSIKPILIQLNNDNRYKIKSYLANFIRNIIPMNIMGILPQIINLHSEILVNSYKKSGAEIDNNGIYTVYGCLVDYMKPVDSNYHWLEFVFEIPNDFSPNIFEVCQYLQ